MNLSDILADDFRTFDSLETVTFTQRATTIEVAGAKQQMLRHDALEQLANSFGLETNYRSFSLPVANLAGVEPRPGDTLRDGLEINWRVLSATLMTVGTRWVLACMQMR